MSKVSEQKQITNARGSMVMYGGFALLGAIAGIFVFAEGEMVLAAVVLAVSVLLALESLRLRRGGIQATADHLVSVHEFGKSTVLWRDIDRFEYRGLKGLGVWKKNGDWVFLNYMSQHGDRLYRVMSELNTELQRSR